MNAEGLLEHYAWFADAPDTIARLRRLILNLAVRGKLTQQDPRDEPADDLLMRLRGARQALVRRGLMRAAKILPMLDTQDVVFPAPLGWIWMFADDLWDFENGDRSSNYPSRDQLVSSGVPFVNAGHLVNGKVAMENMNFITRGKFESLAGGKLRRCDQLYCLRGSLGKHAVFDHEGDAAIASSLVILRPIEASLVPYLALYLDSDVAQTMLRKFDNGSAQPNLSSANLRRYQVPLPPLAEQHRIVAKVDELMTLCDQLEAARATREAARDRLAAASLARLNTPDPETFVDDSRFSLDALPALTARPDQIKQLRQTILNLAVRGKLVPQDETDEPASELLKRIAKERTGRQAIKKARRNGEVEISRRQMETALPSNWQWTNLDEIALSMRYGTSIKCEYEAQGVPVLRIPNVSEGTVSLDDIKFGPLMDGEVRELALDVGDLLMIRSNGSLNIVGRAAVVTSQAAGMAFAGYLVRLRTSRSNIKPEYIWLALKSSDIRDQIERPIRSAVGLKNVNLTEFGALTFPLPPLSEQHRIVAKVDELMTLCDQLEANLDRTATTRRRLLDALLAEAVAPVLEAA